MNDLPDSVFHSHIYLFADDTKCFKHKKQHSDMDLLQSDINCLFNQSIISCLSFHPSKSLHLSFNQKFFTSYTINATVINSLMTHKDLGILISSDLEWSLYIKTMSLPKPIKHWASSKELSVTPSHPQ